MVFHFMIFFCVTSIGMSTLTLVSAKNASLHLLFPFRAPFPHRTTDLTHVPSRALRRRGFPAVRFASMVSPRSPSHRLRLTPCGGPSTLSPPSAEMFDFLFLYSFYSIRFIQHGVGYSWVLQQAAVQVCATLRPHAALQAGTPS